MDSTSLNAIGNQSGSYFESCMLLRAFVVLLLILPAPIFLKQERSIDYISARILISGNQNDNFPSSESQVSNFLPEIRMPCLYITTNVNLDGVDKAPIFSEATKAVSTIIGKPEHFVMIIIKGEADIQFNGNKEAAVYAEIVSMGGINKEVKRNLIEKLGTIMEDKLCVPRTRFFLKVYDTTAFSSSSKL